MAETLQQLLRERLDQDTPALKYGERVWTWRQHLAEASATAAALIGVADRERPLHVGALLLAELHGFLVLPKPALKRPRKKTS